MIRAGVRTDSMIGVTKFRIRKPSLRNTAHISTRNTFGISCARSYRTLRDGSFEGRFPRHFVPGYDRCCPYGTRLQTFRNSICAFKFVSLRCLKAIFDAWRGRFLREAMVGEARSRLVVEKTPLREHRPEWDDRGHVPAT